MIATIERTIAAESATPSAPPIAASIRLSDSSCANSRPRLAPMAARTASSRWRALPCASIRLATLAQAISSTKPTAPSSSQSADRVSCGRKLCFSGSTLARPAGVRLRVRRGDLLRHHVHVGVRLRQRDVGLQPPHDEQPVEVVVELFRRERERNRQRGRFAILGRHRRQDADHRAGLAIDANLGPDNVAVAVEPLLPQPVPEDDHLIVAGTPLVGGEVPAEKERQADHRVEARRHADGIDLFGALGGGDVDGAPGPGDEILERRRLLLPVDIVAGRRDVAEALHPRPDHDELVRIGIGHRREQRAVDDAEDGRIGADSEREGQDGDRREAGPAQQEAEAEHHVPSEMGEHPSTS